MNPADLLDRQWPSKRITKTPRRMSTDPRDGNQTFIEPMDLVRKRRTFDLPIKLGYREIEIGFPTTSQTDYDFVRFLTEDGMMFEDVTISMLTQFRSELIECTIEATVGLPHATVHLYDTVTPVFRGAVFHVDKAQTIEPAQSGVREIITQVKKRLGDGTILGLEYSPEIFVDTELDFTLEARESVVDVWEPGEGRGIVLNLPPTVERSILGVFVGQIEWVSRNLSCREYVALSVHSYNNRSTDVVTAELALLAGAGHIEGCLLSQGERTGNVDLVTLGLNLSSRGIDPGIDFSDMDAIRRTIEYRTQMETSPRTPYVGDLVYTSFSGSHQDAIEKGLIARKARVDAAGGDEEAVMRELPYLPVDSHDVGRSYEAVVRVNSQSGKGDVVYLMSTTHALELPCRLQARFFRVVQYYTDTYGGRISAVMLWQIFVDEYLPTSAAPGLEPWGRFEIRSSQVSSIDDEHVEFNVMFTDSDETVKVQAMGMGLTDAFVSAFREFDSDMHILSYSEHVMSQGRDARATAHVKAAVDGQIVWGVGIDPSIARVSHKAAISTAN